MSQVEPNTLTKKEERKAHFSRMQAVAVAPQLSSGDLSAISSELKEMVVPGRRRQLSHGRKIIAAGYYYSGSGALLDFVADHEGAISWPTQGEVRFINLPWGVNELYESVLANGELQLQPIVRLYLHLHGKMPVDAFKDGHRTHLAKVANRASRLAIRSDLGKAHSYAVKEAIPRLIDVIGRGKNAILPILSDFFQRYDSELRRLSGASVIAYDRAVPPQELQRSELLGSDAAIIMVHRDPRSQFVDITQARAERGQAVMTAEHFIKMIRSRRRKARSDVIKHGGKFDEAVALISFEDLVTSSSVRGKIRELLGLGGMRYSSARLLPDVSWQNIANYKQHSDQMSIREIEEALPEYLWPNGSSCGSYVLRRPALEPLADIGA